MPTAEGTWDTRALGSMEPGAKNSRVELVWALKERAAFWEGDSMGRDVGTCVLSLLEDTKAGSPYLAGGTMRDQRDLKDITLR